MSQRPSRRDKKWSLVVLTFIHTDVLGQANRKMDKWTAKSALGKWKNKPTAAVGYQSSRGRGGITVNKDKWCRRRIMRSRDPGSPRRGSATLSHPRTDEHDWLVGSERQSVGQQIKRTTARKKESRKMMKVKEEKQYCSACMELSDLGKLKCPS